MAENADLLALLAEMKKSMEKGQKEMKKGQEEMRKGQEETRKGQEEMKNQIQSHVESKVGEIKDHVNSCIEKIEEDVQSAKREIGEIKGEVERKNEEVEDKVQGKIEEVKEKVQVKIGDLEKRLSELEDRPINFPSKPELTYSRPTVKSLKFDGKTSWTVFKTQFDVVSSANGWNNRVKASPIVASLRESTAEDCIEDETAEARRKKDVERLMSLAYAECPQDVRDSLAAQYFVDAIRDEDTQHATSLMDAKDFKSALAYSMKYEAAKTVSKTSRNVRSIEIEDGTGKEKDEKLDCLLETLEKLLNSHVVRKKTPRRNPNVTCWKCNKKGHLQRECQTISPNREKLMYGRLTGRRLPFLNKARGKTESFRTSRRKKWILLGRIYLWYPLFDVGGHRCQCHSHLEKNEIRTGGEEIPLFSASAEHSKSCSVLAKEKTIIPARPECLIQGVPEVSGKFRYAATDFPSQVSQKGVLVAATLVDLKREAIPVRVLNLDNKPKTVDKGAVIATCEPVVDIVARPQEFSESLRLPSILENLEGLNEEQRAAVNELLQEFQNLFSTSDSDVGRCNMTRHRINTGNHPPIKQYPRRLQRKRKLSA
ncbi:hypothetical protein AVEN_2207-1 [Araneus ventricosus]|uniref:CCHC-type domain-containing protein n=1 Tax=Araneus ventricosus TaxID=182803 RepID=A0A4Y2UHF9_ARAVE|nr:hypothetical protein AVEN_2207-1 [Araneus ventricosus]